MARRDQRIADLNRHKRVDLNGVPSYLENAYIMATTSEPRGESWGFDGFASAGRVYVHKDGHGTSHTGACAIEPDEEPVARVIRQHHLEHAEASLLRDCAAHARDKLPARARRLGIPERTLRRVRERLRDRLDGLLRECAA